jgi:F0F1-type ATP synthase assembly protein I
VANQPEERSALGVGIEWSSRITTVALGFSVPPVIGFIVDRWLGWAPVATLVGILVGFVSGLLQTVRLASGLPGAKTRGKGSSGGTSDTTRSGSPEIPDRRSQPSGEDSS